MTLRRRTATLVALCALIGSALLTGCTPQSASTPTPTPHFTSEAQAYAAAEQTYRNYVDALNKVDLSEPATFEAVYKWATGDALGSDKKSLTKMHSDGWSIRGSSGATQFHLISYRPDPRPVITIEVCRDVSKVDVEDSQGNSLVGSGRPDLQPLRVQLEASAATSTGLAVSTVEGGQQKCAD